MVQENGHYGPKELGESLSRMNAEGGFPIAVITNQEGLVIASSSSSGLNPDRQSAVVAKMREAAELVGRQLSMGSMDEISLYDEDGQRLVCRPVSMNGDNLILAVMVPERGQPYRRSTNKMITLLRHNWKTRGD